MPHISDSKYHESATLSDPVCVSLFTRALFSPNKHFISLKKKKKNYLARELGVYHINKTEPSKLLKSYLWN